MSKINWGKLNDIQNKDKLDASIINSKHNLISKSAVSGIVPKRTISLDDDTEVKIYLFADLTDIIKNEWKLLSEMLKNKKNLTLRVFNTKDPSSLGLINKYNIIKFPSIIFKFNDTVLPYTDKIIANDIFMFINIHITQFGKLDITLSTGESLVLLTEAPNNNIIRWASPLYESKGSLRKMIATGYHSTEVWTSILFQIMHIMYTLQENEIFFEEFSLENNIYIKDLYLIAESNKDILTMLDDFNNNINHKCNNCINHSKNINQLYSSIWERTRAQIPINHSTGDFTIEYCCCDKAELSISDFISA
jgi:hypothetical protein